MACKMGTLSSKDRSKLPDSDFAIPSQRAYPIPDLAHARNALSRVAQNGTPSEQAQVRAAVYKRYPELKPSNKSIEINWSGAMAPTFYKNK